MRTFPKRIFVRWEPVRYESPYLVVDTKQVGGEDGDAVAIYERKEVKTKRVRESLE